MHLHFIKLARLVYGTNAAKYLKYQNFIFPDLVNVFEVFLPQLLLYPNPSDPLNGEAAALMMRDRAAYEQRVKGKKLVIVMNSMLCYSCA